MNTNIKAVILAAGKGTRMKHLTAEKPKPMLEINGTPVLEIIVKALRDFGGVKQLCIITGYRAETIKDYFTDGKKFGISISYVTQTVQDGTGKAPELAKEFVGLDSFFLAYGDILTEPSNYGKMVKTLTDARADGIITVRKGDDVTKGAAVMFDGDGNLTDIIEKPPAGTVTSPYNNSGIYIFTSRLFDYTPKLQKSQRGEYELPDALRAMARDGLKIKCVELDSFWMDVRDPEVLAEAQTFFTSQK